jgi:hypothetical protein
MDQPVLWVQQEGLSGTLSLELASNLPTVAGLRAIGAVLDSLKVPGKWTDNGRWTVTLPLPAAERIAQVIVALAGWRTPAPSRPVLDPLEVRFPPTLPGDPGGRC